MQSKPPSFSTGRSGPNLFGADGVLAVMVFFFFFSFGFWGLLFLPFHPLFFFLFYFPPPFFLLFFLFFLWFWGFWVGFFFGGGCFFFCFFGFFGFFWGGCFGVFGVGFFCSVAYFSSLPPFPDRAHCDPPPLLIASAEFLLEKHRPAVAVVHLSPPW